MYVWWIFSLCISLFQYADLLVENLDDGTYRYVDTVGENDDTRGWIVFVMDRGWPKRRSEAMRAFTTCWND